MRAEFLRNDDGSEVVGDAWWDGRRAQVESDDPDVRRAIDRVFRITPVVVDHGAMDRRRTLDLPCYSLFTLEARALLLNVD